MGEGVSGRLRVAAWALARERETAWSENASCWSPLAGAAARSSSTPSAASYPLRARTRVRLRECAQYRVSVWRHRIPPHACVCAQTNMVPPEPPPIHTHTPRAWRARTRARAASRTRPPRSQTKVLLEEHIVAGRRLPRHVPPRSMPCVIYPPPWACTATSRG